MVWSIDFQQQSEDIGAGDIEIDLPIKGQTGGGSGGSQGGTVEISDPMNTPFTGFDGCTLGQKNHLVRVWWDVIELSKGALITAVFGNIMDLYTSKTTGKIRISCKDLPQPHRTENEQVYCKKDTITANKHVGGYAFSAGPSYEEGTIVMCPPFFAPGQEHLLVIIAHLDDHPEDQHSPLGMSGKAHMLLHELTHLSSVEGQNDVIIKYQVFNEKELRSDKVYGLYWVQRMGDSFKQRARTHLNADTYAWYASLKFFEGLYGIPDAYVASRGDEPGEDEGDGEEMGPTKALNIILENSRHGIPNDADFYDRMKWLFFSAPYGTAPQCQVDPIPVAEAPADKSLTQLSKPQFPHGTFEVKTQDGMCEYKNDGKGNAGALWCDTAHSCRAHAGMTGEIKVIKSCSELSKKIKGWVEQRAIVGCEW